MTTTTDEKPGYWVDPEPGEPAGAWALRLTATYAHDRAVDALTRALQLDRMAADLQHQAAALAGKQVT